MNLLALRYFTEVAEHLNFSEAARSLHIPQPGLSQQITSLEESLGVKLLNRTTRKVTLTDEGKYLYKHLSPSFETIETTLSELEKTGSAPQTTIKIATVASAASNWVPKLLNQLKIKFGNVEFYIQETTSTQAIELIKQGKSDIALIRTPSNIRQLLDEQLKIIELTRHPMKLVVPADHRVAAMEVINLYELRNETFLHYDRFKSPSLHYMMENVCLTAGFVPKILVTGPELLTISNLISNGIGVTLMPQDMIELLPTDKIRAIDIKNQSANSSISVAWNNRRKMPILTQYALDILEEYGSESNLKET